MSDVKIDKEKDVLIVNISDLHMDKNNANAGTERGEYMLEHSLETYGAGRSIVVDRDMNVISGNKTIQKWAEMGFEQIVLVRNANGKMMVGVQREDMDLYDPADMNARGLAHADNRVGEVNYRLEPNALLLDLGAGLDLSGLYKDAELEQIQAMLDEPPTLDDLEDEYGEGEERETWPWISVQVTPETFRIFHSQMERTGLTDEAEAFAFLLGLIDFDSEGDDANLPE